jgi:hypothetical protein
MRSLAITILLAVTGQAFAHHGYEATYDSARLLSLSGQVVLFSIENPHSRIVIEVANQRGGRDTWTVETVPASRAAQMNHPLSTVNLKPGDQATVTGWPARDGSKRLGGHKLTLPDGREIMLRPAINLPARRD